jgi:hypothetical protein
MRVQHQFHSLHGRRIGGMNHYRTDRRPARQVVDDFAAGSTILHSSMLIGDQFQIVIERNDNRFRQVLIQKVDECGSRCEKLPIKMPEAVGKAICHDRLPVLIVLQNRNFERHTVVLSHFG